MRETADLIYLGPNPNLSYLYSNIQFSIEMCNIFIMNQQRKYIKNFMVNKEYKLLDN